jgi:Protein of unknown function (DUF3306)
MSGQDVDKAEAEAGFLARWSRRKRAAQGDEVAPPRPEATPLDAATPHAVQEAETPFDVSTLPTLDSITKDSSLSAFMQKGVPDDLKNAALRVMWSADPFIRDDTGPVDYGWDFNNPESIPGFGAIGNDTDIASMVSDVMGRMPEPADAALQTQHSDRGAAKVLQGNTQADVLLPNDQIDAESTTRPQLSTTEVSALRLTTRQDDDELLGATIGQSADAIEITSDSLPVRANSSRRSGGAIPR